MKIKKKKKIKWNNEQLSLQKQLENKIIKFQNIPTKKKTSEREKQRIMKKGIFILYYGVHIPHHRK
jgi:hypothetical protein